MAFDGNGKTLASAGMDGSAKLWRVERNEGDIRKTLLHTLEGHTDVVHAVSFSPDGRTLATAGSDGRVGLFDVETGEGDLFEAHEGRIANVAFTPDGGSLVTACNDDFTANRWDLSQEPPQVRQVAKARDALTWATLRPDGRQLATVSSDMTVRLWDLETKKELFALRLPTQRQHGVPLWDFDFRCTPAGDCWIAVPLTRGRLALYRLPYLHPPESIAP